MTTRSKSQTRIINIFIEKLQEVKILIGEFHFYLYVKRDRLEFRLHVREFWMLFVIREKAKYFCVTEFYKGV